MRYAIAGLVLLLSPFTAFAQPAGPAVTPPTEPTTVSFVTGFSVGADEVGPLAGGSLSAGVTSWLSLEGAAGFADRGPGVNGVYALASAVFNIRPASSRVVPFASVGGGFYHANFDMRNREMFGQLGVPLESLMEFVAGSGGYQAYMRMYQTGGARLVQVPLPRQVPQFYASRFGTMMLSENGTWGRRSFTDPATSVGAGASIRLSDKVVLRPDARAIMVFNDGETNVVGLFNLGVGFRF
jgi:hypothetical protein